MRMFVAAAASAVVIAVGMAAGGLTAAAAVGEPQRPGTPQGQAQLERAVRESADEVLGFARDWLGHLHPSGQAGFRQWMLAVTAWKREEGAGPAALLAEGVLFDCLGRTLGLNTGFTSGQAVDPRFNELGLPNRLQEAAKLFEQALKSDPDLYEARFRAIRIRSLDSADATLQLEALANSGEHSELAYLAAVSRAILAHRRQDNTTAIGWYRHAQTLQPRSTAAAVGLSVLTPAAPIAVDRLDPDDLYYNYPCRILTPSIASELTRRVQDLSRQ